MTSACKEGDSMLLLDQCLPKVYCIKIMFLGADGVHSSAAVNGPREYDSSRSY